MPKSRFMRELVGSKEERAEAKAERLAARDHDMQEAKKAFGELKQVWKGDPAAPEHAASEQEQDGPAKKHEKKGFLARAPIATFEKITLYQDHIKRGFADDHPLEGVTAVVERGSDLQKRITATRLVALGVFSLAAKKKSGGEWWLLVEGPDFAWTEEVDRKKQEKARKFAAAVNTAAKRQHQ